ncbi:maltotransferase domain-containing protein [Sulfuriroseicoccus oceanibius]|uniref:Alpha-1,4-glucan:maltose-1-phosphate maltosyltransferase n=1 Tax=Sulfuriroseicoccus oceanibius TaxID=2707525 RepID=A0A6B3L3Z9_9BACT|nr:maltotransferase domain-containing protein [Sulfuriroseicoccus oceanibius]QQL45842.1 DUF3416 domain-containing protein [Sulfuriroseicoccus oceanibius]
MNETPTTSLQSFAPSVVITAIEPAVDRGRHPVKRIVNELLVVSADVFKDGHDLIAASLLWRVVGDSEWTEVKMDQLENDRWSGSVRFSEPGRYEYTVASWPDKFSTWVSEFGKKHDAGQEDLSVETAEGALLVKDSARRAQEAGAEEAAKELDGMAELMATLKPAQVRELMESDAVRVLMEHWADRDLMTTAEPAHPVIVESERARFSAWYEFFPRSAFGDASRHARLRDCEPLLDHAKNMGFDVIYFPPIHPIGEAHRKGKNNSVTAEPGDVGSPWAIGGKAGGHYAVEPALGTVDDFVWLVERAKERGIEIAMDFAINCSPEHPYVKAHPDWFFQRPDGSIKYAENPPKKYQDIYPLNFHCSDWRNLWSEMKNILEFWVSKGVRIFRVDNPHTKPVAFWEWVIGEIRKNTPDILFLAEAFTAPKMMQELGKIGFSQSYTYFTWRTNKEELTEYARELMQGPMKEYYRGNFWPNTPDILAYELWNASPEKFKIRATLAALMSSTWGMYSGFEFCENDPFPPKEEYNNSEKYQLVDRDWNAPGIVGHIADLNRVRREHPAFAEYSNIEFGSADNSELLVFAKRSSNCGNRVLVIVNMDDANAQASNVHVPLEFLGLSDQQPYHVEDLMTGEVYEWQGHVNYVELRPTEQVAHVFVVRQ